MQLCNSFFESHKGSRAYLKPCKESPVYSFQFWYSGEHLEAILRVAFGVQRKKNFKCPYLKIAFSTWVSFIQNREELYKTEKKKLQLVMMPGQKSRAWWSGNSQSNKVSLKLYFCQFSLKGIDLEKSVSKNIEPSKWIWVWTMMTKWCFDAFTTHHLHTFCFCHNNRN